MLHVEKVSKILESVTSFVMAGRSFFNLRRLFGVMLLLLSLAVCVSWVRSLSVVDQIEFEDCFQRTHRISTVTGIICWRRWDRQHRSTIGGLNYHNQLPEWVGLRWETVSIGHAVNLPVSDASGIRFWLCQRLSVTTNLGPDTSRLSEGIWGPSIEIHGMDLFLHHLSIVLPVIVASCILLLVPKRATRCGASSGSSPGMTETLDGSRDASYARDAGSSQSDEPPLATGNRQ